MKRAATIVGEFLNSLGAGVFIGAYVMIALTAPVAFRLMPSRLEAGILVGQSLDRFVILSYGCIGAMILGRALSWRWGGFPTRRSTLRVVQILALAALATLTIYIGGGLGP